MIDPAELVHERLRALKELVDALQEDTADLDPLDLLEDQAHWLLALRDSIEAERRGDLEELQELGGRIAELKRTVASLMADRPDA